MSIPYQPETAERDWTLHAIMLLGDEPVCGFQCCCFHLYYGTGKRCIATTLLPPELDGFITLEELNEFKTKINSIFDETVYPFMPGICTHYCIPCSYSCCRAYWEARRESLIDEHVLKTNERLSNKGLWWEVVPVNKDYVIAGAPLCVLKYNPLVPPPHEMMQPHCQPTFEIEEQQQAIPVKEAQSQFETMHRERQLQL